MDHRKRQFVQLILWWLAVMVSGEAITRASDQRSAGNDEQYALLIGCTHYPLCPQAPELWGPANDIPVFARLLQRKFHFPRENIRVLLGWPEEPDDRPTRQNITSAFEELIDRAQEGVQLFIMMNGHGTQVPVADEQINVLDPRNRELDGLDEVFLPADVEPGLTGSIRDNQIADWLRQMRARGAQVWILFDCCHAGTMTRGGLGFERCRGVNAEDLGVSAESLRRRAPGGGSIPHAHERSPASE